jgi:hypothetical protein
MKKLYFTLLALIISSMTFAQVLVNEGFETGNTVDETPVGWICNDNGWKAGITIPDDNVARGRKPHTGDWYMYSRYNTDVWTYKEINVTAGNYYRVSFWYVTWHTDHFNLEVKAGASPNPSAMTINVVPMIVVDNTEYQQASAVFQATSTGNFYVGFHSEANNFAWYLSIDDVVIEHTDQYCFAIEQLTADTSAYFGESAYLRFLLSNTGEQADTYVLTNTGSLPIEFYQNGSQVSQVSLAYNTSVELIAKATLPMNLNNGEVLHATFDVTSSHSAPTQSADYTITALAPISTFPLTEGFDGTTFPPAGWQNVATNGNYSYEQVTSNDWPACTPHEESGAMARFYCFTSPAGSSCNLISPKLQLSATDNTVRYWIFRNYNNNIMGPDRINVYYSPTTNTADGTLLGTVHRNTMLEPVVGENNDWYEYSYTFDSPEGYGFVILEAVSGYGWNLCIDDIYINSTSIDNDPPTVVSLKGTQIWAETEMDLTLRVYDESGVPDQMQATYTINGQSQDITLNKSSKSNYDFTATLPAQPNHTTASIVFHLVDYLGHSADSDPYELHWDWQRPILLETFEECDILSLPEGWTTDGNPTYWDWNVLSTVYFTDYYENDYVVAPHGGIRQAVLEWDDYNNDPQDQTMITPVLTIERPTVLTFWTWVEYGDPYYDHFVVRIYDCYDGTWSDKWDSYDHPTGQINSYTEPVSVVLDQYIGKNIKIGFRGYNAMGDCLGSDWFIDDVKVVATDTIPTSINEMELQSSIYPNPVDDLMTIRADEPMQHISIYNILGVKVKEVFIDNKEAVIDLSKMEAGVYMIEIVGVNNKSVKTFIKQ